MKKFYYSFPLIILTLIGGYFVFPKQKATVFQREQNFNFNWDFALVNKTQFENPEIADINWEEVKLPHDWSIEFPFDSIQGEGATGYLPGGYGLYKKEFNLTISKNKTTYLYFDGIYNNASLYLNGIKLGEHPYGYSPFYFDITDALKQNDSNTLLVKVDRSRYADSRWYTGSGIYRNVKLITTSHLHIPVWGTFIKTMSISSSSARVELDITVKNKNLSKNQFYLKTKIFNPNGAIVGERQEMFSIEQSDETTFKQNFEIVNPELWDIQSPAMYKAVTHIIQNDEVIDQYETPFGIRSFSFHKDKGFFLNGENIAIKGVCLHHDAGLVGAAVPNNVWRRRLEKLKKAGCNAIRISHNPGSEDFLNLCDEMGFLVQEEFFDEWDYPKDKRLNQNEQSVDYVTRGYTEHFQKWAEVDLKNTVKRDRNHPSIIQWSIGNEIEWTYPSYSHASGYFNMNWQGNYFWEKPPISPETIKTRFKASPKEEYTLAETAQKLSNWTKELDDTRPIIANCILPSVSHVSGYTDALDIVGYSYRRVLYDYGYENYPDKPIMGTENLVQWHEWKSVEERPFISGTFFWTGIDYMGESNKSWPRKATPSGMLDVAGFEKPSYHMIKSLWNSDPHIYIATQTAKKSIFKIDESTGEAMEKKPGSWERALWFWHDVNEHWNYKNKELIIAEVYSNCSEVEMFLNGKSLGKKKLKDFPDHIYKWPITYESGELIAIGIKDGREIRKHIFTTNKATEIALTSYEKATSKNNNIIHVIVELLDTEGRKVKNQEATIEFKINGLGKILGVDNGAADNVQSFQSSKIKTSKGKALLIVQLEEYAKEVEVIATTADLETSEKRLTIRL